MPIDVQSIAGTEVTGAMDTTYTPVPEGDRKIVIQEFALRDGVAGPESKNPGQQWVALDLKLIVDDPEAREAMDRDEVRRTHSLFLDINEAGTGLDMGKGKNVQLGRWREAAGINDPAKPFKFSDFNGKVLLATFKHKPNRNTGDPEDFISKVGPLV